MAINHQTASSGNSIPVDLFIAAIFLGFLCLTLFGLGLLGLLEGRFLLLAPGLLLLAAIMIRRRLIGKLPRTVEAPRQFVLQNIPTIEKLAIMLFLSIFLLALLQALTPAWDYDGLMYHLQGPRLFLQVGRIVPLPENWLTYYPFLVEMLFTIGLAFGSEAFAKLIHLAFAALLVAATYSAARRFTGSTHAWLAAAILVGIPIFPIWAGFAYSDMAWALYEFLALYASLIWIERRQLSDGEASENQSRLSETGLLTLAGVMMGFALGTKYMALGGAGVLGLLILWHSSRDGWRLALRNAAVYSVAALLVGMPWYLKNYLWTGNPVYPFFISPGGDVGERVALWLEYMNGFGAPRTLLGTLSLPILLYTQHYRFGTFLGSIEIPSILFPLAVFYPFTRRTPVLNALAVWTVARFVVWAFGAQQTRFLLPVFPALSILAGYVLATLASRLRGSTGRVLVRGLGFGVLAVTLVYSILFFMSVRPLETLLGTETRQEFLRRQLRLYPLQEYIQTHLPAEARVWMLWDGRGYYCDERCVPDIDQSRWTQVVMQTWDVDRVADELQRRGATHLLISKQDANFVAQFDRSGLQAKAQDFLEDEFIPACTRPVIHNEYYDLVELTCP